ncbi:hypothetical protein POX_c04539 [Penicillium oxalicum]|uniref:hypothetical protein n=1 Tax=Penicillium oxalicum TaxID=69781 RepID=UPI0020B820BA|nr:hypothetical protein POX_c04539 [Penicillium oxalicum]KAI2791672.1 hypothetical protein POX_c04539 [Penicillium oxalicum]
MASLALLVTGFCIAVATALSEQSTLPPRYNSTPGLHRTAQGTFMLPLNLQNLCSHEISQTLLSPEVSV